MPHSIEASTSAPSVHGVPQPHSPEDLWRLLQNPQSSAHGAQHLGDALVQSGVISARQLAEALQTQVEERKLGVYRQLGRQLLDKGVLNEAQLRQAIAGWLGNRVVDARHYRFDPEALAMVPRNVAEAESVLPLLRHEDLLVVLMADPLDKRLHDELRFMTQMRIVPVLAAPGTLMPALERAYQTNAGSPVTTSGTRMAAKDLAVNLMAGSDAGVSEPDGDIVSESDNTLVRMINSLIEEAIAQKASDIHIETRPAPKTVRIRLRLDGELKR